MNRREFQQLSEIRLREANLLLAANAPDGAYYLAGYVVECAFKSCISKATQKYDFPDLKRVRDSYEHRARSLVDVAGLKSALEEAIRDSEFAWRWEIVVQWSQDSRYAKHSAQDASALIEAIENRKHGILQWLKKHY